MKKIFQLDPAWHKVSDDPNKNYGVHGVSGRMVLINKGKAVHFIFYTGIMLPETYEWWESKGIQPSFGTSNMGVDVGYHSPYPIFEGQEISWPTKMRKTGKGPMDIAFDKIGEKPPICDYIGAPCYCDGSAIRGDEWFNIMVKEGSETIWKMLSDYYKETFEK